MAAEIKFLTDEDLRGPITEGVRTRLPDLDIVRVQDAGLRSFRDPLVLEFAASESRIVLSQDISSMPSHAAERLSAGERMPGLILIPDTVPIGRAVDAIVTVAECSLEGEWEGRILFLPLFLQ